MKLVVFASRPRPWTNDELLSLPEAAAIPNARRSNR